MTTFNFTTVIACTMYTLVASVLSVIMKITYVAHSETLCARKCKKEVCYLAPHSPSLLQVEQTVTVRHPGALFYFTKFSGC